MDDFSYVDGYNAQISSSSGAGPSNYHSQQYGQDAQAPSSSAFTFPSPVRLVNYSEWKREQDLRQNVASMFNFVEPRVQRFGDDASMRTDRAVMDGSNDDDDDESGTQTPKAGVSDWSSTRDPIDAEQQMIYQVCRDSQWPEEKESRPSTPKPFPAEAPDEMAFLSRYPTAGEAVITYLKDDGTKDRIEGLHKSQMAETSELIGFVFEAESRPGSERCHLDMLTERTAKPFARFLHIESYALNDKAGRNVYDDAPTSLLIHIELCRVAKFFDLTKLVNESYVNIQRQCEFSCSSPRKPIDLEAAILYLYKYRKDFGEHFERIMDTFINYCVACFYDNRLGADLVFKKLAQENNDFYRRLYDNSINRGDSVDVTPGIVQLPFDHLMPVERPQPKELYKSLNIQQQIQNHVAPKVEPLENIDPFSRYALVPNLPHRPQVAPTPQPDLADQIERLWSSLESPRKRRAGSDTLKGIEEREESDAAEEEEGDEAWEDVIPIRKQLRITNPDPGVEDEDTESEFEAVARPSDDVVALSSAENTDAESDWERIPLPKVRFAEQELPNRSQASSSSSSAAAAAAAQVQHVAGDVDVGESDSEWSDLGRE